MSTEAAVTESRPTSARPIDLQGRDGRETRAERNVRLRTERLSVSYGSKLAISEISLAIYDRAVTAIIGPSGCGKTTLLRAFNRMNDLIASSHSEGRIEFDGIDILGADVDVVRLRRQIGMVFQKPNPFPMSIYDNIAYGPKQHGVRGKGRLDDIVEGTLRRTALWHEVKDRLKRPATAISGGQQQRLCIARALAVEPQVILMDEPCSALDPMATLKIEDLMKDLANEYTIVIVTHNMQQAARVSDYTAFMLAGEERIGRLIEYRNTDAIFTTPEDKRTEDYITGRFG